MKSTVVLNGAFCGDGLFEKSFNDRSAFSLCLDWAFSVNGEKNDEVVILCDGDSEKLFEQAAEKYKKVSLVQIQENDCLSLIKTLYKISCDHKSDFLVYAFADCPFLNINLTEELIKTHTDYSAEYTFADGYPYGLSPEIIDKGTLGILSELAAGIQSAKGLEKISRSSIWNLMSSDINAFEIETVIAKKDYRMLRLEFETSSKLNRLACVNAFEAAAGETDIVSFCDKAASSAKVLRTVPAFFNIQISKKYNQDISYIPYKKLLERDGKTFEDMSFEDYSSVVAKIAECNPHATVSLSCWGEPLCNRDFVKIVKETCRYPDLRLFVETDGILLTEEIVRDCAAAAGDRMDWCVLLDAVDGELYAKIHGLSSGGAEEFAKAVESVSLLEKYFEGHVYPQMVRMHQTEEQLEGFYRYWKKSDSPSKGNFMIQKFDHFAGFTADERSADLAPLTRHPCWHLRRDFVILADGTVPMCRVSGFAKVLGNVHSDSIETIFEKFDGELKAHIDGSYCSMCRACDEYYTFNF